MLSGLFNAAVVGVGMTATAVGLSIETGRLFWKGMDNE